jgi:hypothetical protein
MLTAVIALADLNREPALEFAQGHYCPLLGIAVLALGNRRAGRSRQDLQATHEGSDQSFGVAAEVRPARWPAGQFDTDTELLAASAERPAVKLRGVVQVQTPGQPAGHEPSSPSSANHFALDVTTRVNRYATVVALGDSKLTEKPSTQRVATSMATDRTGRPMGCRYRSSTTMTSQFV